MSVRHRLALKLDSLNWPTGGGGGGLNQVVFPAPIGPTSTVFNPAINPGPVTVQPAFIAATGSVFAPTINNGGVTIQPNFIAATGGAFDVTMQPGGVTVLPNFLAATGSVFNPTITNSGSYSTEAQTYFNAFTTDPGTTRKDLLATMIDGLVSDGVFVLLDALYMLASHDSQSSLVNVKDPTQSATTVNSPTFTTDRGYAGNGSTSYVVAAANIQGGAYGGGNNDMSLFTYVNLQGGQAGARANVGMETQSARITLLATPTSGANETFRCNDATDTVFQVSQLTRKGMRCITRTSSTAKDSQYNGSAAGNGTVSSSTFTNEKMCAGKSNTVFSNDRFACFGHGKGMTQTQMTALHSRIHTYLTAIGANY